MTEFENFKEEDIKYKDELSQKLSNVEFHTSLLGTCLGNAQREEAELKLKLADGENHISEL